MSFLPNSAIEIVNFGPVLVILNICFSFISDPMHRSTEAKQWLMCHRRIADVARGRTLTCLT